MNTMIKRITNNTLSILGITLSLLAIVSLGGVDVEAQSLSIDATFKVNTPKGLNLRDENCNYITTMPYGSLVISTANRNSDGNLQGPRTRTCTVKGKTYTLMEFYYSQATHTNNSEVPGSRGYAAIDFLDGVRIDVDDMVIDPGVFTAYVEPAVGLNIRNKQCQKTGAISKGTAFNIPLYGKINDIVCEVNGVKYAMTSNGDPEKGYVATAFLESEGNSTSNNEFGNLSYANQYFDNLKINYPTDWEFITDTEQNNDHVNLLNRNIRLRKGNTKLNLYLQPDFIIGCGPGIEESELNLAKGNVANSSFNRFERNGEFIYSEATQAYETCFPSITHIIQSNIDSPTSYYAVQGEKVKYFVTITVNGGNHLDEADQIIANSSIK
ncbi:MAG: hypothetical protein AAGF07_02485 [Patescibacteria group bacterium]